MFGCSREDEIRQYPAKSETSVQQKNAAALDELVGKKKPPADAAAAHGALAAGAALEYHVPKGWVEDPPQGLRKASFHVVDAERKVEITVIDLAPMAADLLANVNRWRNQIALAPISKAQLDKIVKPISTMGVQGQYVELQTPKTARPARTILAVVALRPDKVWFLKLFGDTELAQREKANFEQFVKSTKPGAAASTHAAAPPRKQVMPRDAVHGMLPQGMSSEAILERRRPFTFKVPEGWKPGQIQGMRKAAFVVPRDHRKAEVTVIDLPAKSGGLLLNVNRWRKQINLGPTTQEALDKTAQNIKVDGLPAKYVSVLDDAAAKPRLGLLGVVLVRGDKSWFFKMLGDATIVEEEKGHFEQFVKSVRFKEAHGATKK